MTRETKLWIAGIIGAIGALWCLAALFHWKPVPEFWVWWAVPWMYTTLVIAAAAFIVVYTLVLIVIETLQWLLK